jgi:hypothetical protein
MGHEYGYFYHQGVDFGRGFCALGHQCSCHGCVVGLSLHWYLFQNIFPTNTNSCKILIR